MVTRVMWSKKAAVSHLMGGCGCFLSLFIALSLAERCLGALHLACLLRLKAFALVEK